MNEQQDTRAAVRRAYQAWCDAPHGDRRTEATRYQMLARQDERNDEVCLCGVRWRTHFPVGVAGCDFFETESEFEAETATELAVA